jgi:Ca-activated chloride channel family protein
MKKLSLLTSILVMVSGLFISPAFADKTSLFILDASGSMWGQLPDKQTKIKAAKSVLKDVVGQLPSSVSAGLIAYGHRRKGDCSDIEMVQKAQAGGGQKIANQIGQLMPRGKTPISNALTMAGKALTGIEDPTTIVLVSDGLETCKGDPCAVADALAKSHSNLKIHVVGYAVDGVAAKQLQCIAEKGRGAYFTADDYNGLSTALNKVTESIKTEEPIEMAPPVEAVVEPVVEKAETTTLKIKGPGTIRLKLASWTRKPKYWKVLDPETGEVIAKTSKDEMVVMPGSYQIAWRHLEHGAHEVNLPQVIDVKSGEVSIAEIKTGIQLVAPKGMKRPYYWQLIPHGSKIHKFYHKREAAAWYSVYDPVPVPAGDYTLIYRQGEHGYTEVNLGKVTLKEGELLQYPLDQGMNLTWRKEWGDRIYYVQLEDQEGRKLRMRKQGLTILPQGTYKVSFRLKEHGWKAAPFGEIKVTEEGFVDPKLTSGITFKTQVKGEFTVYAMNLDTKQETSLYKKWGPMPLGAGRYRFDMKIKGSKRQTIAPEVVIKEGQFIKAEM